MAKARMDGKLKGVNKMAKGKGGTGKLGRNKDKCKLYKSKFTKERNKISKLRKQLKGIPEDNLQRSILESRIRELEKIIDKRGIDNGK